MAIPLKNLGIQSYPIDEPVLQNIPEDIDIESSNVKPRRATPLHELGIQSYPVEDVDEIIDGTENISKSELPPQNIRNHKENEYTGKNPVASFAKNSVAGFVGGIPDIGVGIHNLVSKQENQWPSITDKISNAIDKATGDYTKDTDPYTKHAAQFLFSLFSGGAIGKGIQAVGAASKLGKASEVAEKTGKFVANNLGFTNASAKNVGAGLAGGAAIGASEKADLPIYLEIPAVIGAFILGGKTFGGGSNKLKDSEMLKPLFEKIPGLEKFLQKQNYEELASNINPESISDLMKTSLINKEAEFITQKTLSDLPEEIQTKIKNNPALLTDEEVNLVVEKGMKDFTGQIENLEKEYGLSLTTGEYTGSPKVIAQEDALANRPHVEDFDIAMQNRKSKLTQRIEKIKNDLSSSDVNSEKLGETIASEVNSVYSSVKKMRSDNWNKNFGKVVDENIIPISGYTNKLKEFSQLRPDTLGNEVAIKVAKKKLKDGIQYEKNISPKRVNDILVGMNEDISRFPSETFSRAQMMELKSALESDLTAAIENTLTKEQASMVRKARSEFAADSQILNQIDESILFNKIGKDSLNVPEKIAQSLDNMPASQLKLTFDALKRSPNHQEVIPQIQRYYIENAVKAATKGGADTFNPRIFMEKLPKKAELDVILGDTSAYKEIKDLSVLMRRMAKFQPSRSNSKTAQREQATRNDLEGVSKIAMEATQGNLGSSFKEGLNFLRNQYAKLGNRDKVISELLLSPEHRKNVLNEVGKTQKKRPVLAALSQSISQSPQ